MPMLVQPLSARQVNNNRNNKHPQSQCNATSGDIRKGGVVGDNDFENFDAALQKMTMTCNDDKENVRPSSGKKWRQRLDQNRRRASDSGDANGGGNVLAEVGVGTNNISSSNNTTISKGHQQMISTEKKKVSNRKKSGKKKPQLKSNTSAVVDDGIPLQHLGKGTVSMQNIPILPSSNSPASSKWSSSSPASNNKSGGSGRRNRKKRSKAKKNDAGTNAGGRSVLALLGQYPAMHPTSADGYDGSSSPPPQTSVQMMPCLTDGVYQAQYDPSNYPTDNAIATYAIHQPTYGVQQYPIYTMTTTSDVHMPNGYYVGGAFYYNSHPSNDMHQIDTTTSIDASYYHAHYDPYDGILHQAVAPHSAAHYHESITSKKPLNVNAPVFNPKTS